jgi:hypothetical protein
MTDAERLRIVLAHVRRARKILAQYAGQRTAEEVPKRALVRKLKGVLESDDLERAMTAAPIANLKKVAEQPDGGRCTGKRKGAGLTALFADDLRRIVPRKFGTNS